MQGFLEYAREHNIVVLCYPSHSTHIYQGLDVVIFSVLRYAWTKHQDNYEQECGHPVNKKCFLAVYAKVHLEVLSKENIILAFCATGIVPFNPNAILESLLAPSQQTSTCTTFPISPSSPVHIMTDMVEHTLAHQACQMMEPSTPHSQSESDIDGHDLPHHTHAQILATST